MSQNTWGPHEILELHELLCAETTTAEKMQAAMDKIKDPELKTFMQMSLDAKRKQIAAMQQLAQSAMQTNT